jgi:hypothetical protein
LQSRVSKSNPNAYTNPASNFIKHHWLLHDISTEVPAQTTLVIDATTAASVLVRILTENFLALTYTYLESGRVSHAARQEHLIRRKTAKIGA